MLLCIFDAKKACKKKSLNKFSLAADLLNFSPYALADVFAGFVSIYNSMCPILHVKFQDHRTSGSEKEEGLKFLTIYGHDGHLGNVILTI